MSLNILLLDASTEALSVAISSHLENGFFAECPQQHSQKMLPEISQQLEQANLSLDKLDAIAFAKGPGSFTGVRVGVSVTQGLAYAAQLPVIGISTLQVMAEECIIKHNAKDVFVAIDARMGEIYFAHYQQDAQGFASLVGNESVVAPSKLVLPEVDALCVGTGFETYREDFEKQSNLTFIEHIRLPNIRYAAPLAENEFRLGHVAKAQNAQPSYVRDTVTWKKLPGKA